MATNVSIRLGVTGQAEVKTALDATGQAGQAAFGNIKREMDAASSASDRLNQKLQDVRTKAQGIGTGAQPGFVPANIPGGASPAELRSLEARAAQVRAMVDPVGAAADIAAKSVQGFDTLLAKGAITHAEHAAAVALTAAKYEEFAKKAEHAGGQLGLNSNQIAEGVHVIRALGDEAFSSGLSIRGLLAEGGRIGQIFTEGSGGVGGTFKALGHILGGLLTPINLLIGATVALGVAGAAAGLAYEGGQERLARSLDGIGRRSGATLDRLNQAAASGSSAAGISTGEGINLAAGFTSAGIGVDTTQALIGSAKRYGQFTGQGTSAGGDELAKIFADPAKGMEELNKRLGFVDAALDQTVKNLTAQGDIEGARNALTDAYLKALDQTTSTTWAFGRALDSAGRGIGDFFHSLGKDVAGLFGGGSNQEQLANLQSQLANTQRNDPNNTFEISRLQGQIAPLVAAVQAESDKAAGGKRTQDANQLSTSADALVRRILPDLVRETTSTNSINLLGRAMANPDVMRSLNGAGLSNGQVGQAFDRTVVTAANDNPMKNMADDYRLARQEIEAFTLAEHIAVDARRAEVAVLRETGDVQRAALAAEIARNTLIDKANNAASDRYDMAVQQHDLVGLAPLERQIQEFKNTFEGVGGYLSKDDATRREITDAMKPVQADLLKAGDEITAALQSVASHIRDFTTSSIPGATATVMPSTGFSGSNIATPAMIDVAAKATGLPPSLIAALGQKENGGRLTGATSILGPDGRPASTAYGFGQLTDGAAKDVANVLPGFDKYNPATAVLGSAEYLKLAISRSGGSVAGGLDRYGGHQSGYAADVMRRAGGGIPMSIGGKGGVGMPELKAGGFDRNTEALGVSDIVTTAQDGPLKAANQALQNQIALFGQQRATVGQSTSAIQAAAEAQKLLNQYQNEDPKHVILNWQQITAGVDDYRKNVQAALEAEAAFQKKQQDLIASLDGIRGASKDGLSTFLGDLQKGQTFGRAFGDVLTGIEGKLMSMAENSVIDSLFGKQGSSNGGALGGGLSGILGSLFSGGGSGFQGWMPQFASGTDDAPGGPTLVGEQGPEVVSLPQHAKVLSNSSVQALAGQGAMGAGGGDMHVQIINAHPTATATAKQGTGISRNIVQIMVADALVQSAATNDRGFQAFAKRAGTGRTG